MTFEQAGRKVTQSGPVEFKMKDPQLLNLNIHCREEDGAKEDSLR